MQEGLGGCGSELGRTEKLSRPFWSLQTGEETETESFGGGFV